MSGEGKRKKEKKRKRKKEKDKSIKNKKNLKYCDNFLTKIPLLQWPEKSSPAKGPYL